MHNTSGNPIQREYNVYFIAKNTDIYCTIIKICTIQAVTLYKANIMYNVFYIFYRTHLVHVCCI